MRWLALLPVLLGLLLLALGASGCIFDMDGSLVDKKRDSGADAQVDAPADGPVDAPPEDAIPEAGGEAGPDLPPGEAGPDLPPGEAGAGDAASGG
jgi:hypothetical protein